MAEQIEKGGVMEPCLMAGLDRLIHDRRSIRKYKPEPPPETWIMDMVRSAQQAPSPSNSQPVQLIRIKSEEVRKALEDSLQKGYVWFLQQYQLLDAGKRIRNWINAYFRYSSFMSQAPVLLAAGTLNQRPGFFQHMAEANIIEKDNSLNVEADLAAGLALNNLLLKAQELGLGACILTAPLIFMRQAHPETIVENILNVRGVTIKCFVTIGFADEKPVKPPKNALETFYHVV